MFVRIPLTKQMQFLSQADYNIFDEEEINSFSIEYRMAGFSDKSPSSAEKTLDHATFNRVQRIEDLFSKTM